MSDHRRRERQGGHGADYYDQPPYPAHLDPRSFAGSASPPRSRQHDDPAPRRHKSEKRRPKTPEFVEDPYEKPSRRRSRRDRPEIVNPGPPPPSSRRGPPGPPPDYLHNPPYAPEPPEPERHRSRRERDREHEPREPREPREHRSRRRDRNSMPPVGRDPHPHDPYMSGAAAAGAGAAAGYYGHDPRDGRPPKDARPDPDPRSSRRSRHSPPRHSPPPPHTRNRRDPYEQRGPSPPHDPYGRSPSPPRRHRSRGRPERDPSPTRGRPPPVAGGGRPRSRPAGGKAPPPRRSSMPATTKPRGAAWWQTAWQNPMLQAGARHALTAGAQAAFRSKNDQGPWIGPKGAKVATAALSAAFVDGIMGEKHSGSARQEVLRTGADVAMDDIDHGRLPSRQRKRR